MTPDVSTASHLRRTGDVRPEHCSTIWRPICKRSLRRDVDEVGESQALAWHGVWSTRSGRRWILALTSFESGPDRGGGAQSNIVLGVSPRESDGRLHVL